MNALLCLTFALIGLVQNTTPLGFQDSFAMVEHGTSASVILPPRALTGSNLLFFEPLLGGRYVGMSVVDWGGPLESVALRSAQGQQPPDPVTVWQVMETATGKVFETVRTKPGESAAFLSPKGQGDKVFFSVTDRWANGGVSVSLRSLDVRTGRTADLARFGSGDGRDFGSPGVYASPVSPYIVTTELRQDPEKPGAFNLTVNRVDPATGAVRSAKLDTLIAGLDESQAWSPNGNLFLLNGTVFDQARMGAVERFVFDLDRVTIARSGETFDIYEAPPTQTAFRLEASVSETKLGDAAQKGTALWAISVSKPEAKPVLLSMDAKSGVALENGSGFLYLSQGLLVYRPVVEMSLDVITSARRAASSTVALSNAKQVGIALQLYAADNDDQLPTAAAFRNSVMPYLKSASLVESFVYTFAGGSLASIRDPSRTEMGYIKTDGARAVVYADGSARLVRDDPPR